MKGKHGFLLQKIGAYNSNYMPVNKKKVRLVLYFCYEKFADVNYIKLGQTNNAALIFANIDRRQGEPRKMVLQRRIEHYCHT